jgi:putative transposase
MNKQLPVRKKLSHEIPGWVTNDARYFITVNCLERTANHLCHGEIASALLKSLNVYEHTERWHPWLMVIMPDHIHLIASFNRNPGIRATMKAWKQFFAHQHGIEWQADFFEHRLRNDEEFVEKSSYVKNNPVRKGLVKRPEDWPYIWTRS